jgi:hypothetical protein
VAGSAGGSDQLAAPGQAAQAAPRAGCSARPRAGARAGGAQGRAVALEPGPRRGRPQPARCTAQHGTALHSTAQHCTARHSRHSTAQHCTAWHSMAHHGTARHRLVWSASRARYTRPRPGAAWRRCPSDQRTPFILEIRAHWMRDGRAKSSRPSGREDDIWTDEIVQTNI